MIIVATEDDMVMAANRAIEYHNRAMKKGYGGRLRGTKAHSFRDNFLGAIAEKVVGGYLELPVNFDSFAFGEPDVGDDIDVKSTVHTTGSLVIGKKQDPDWNYVLVINQGWDTCRIAGYLPGSVAMTDKYWDEFRGRTPSYWIPQEDLLPIEDLRSRS